MIKVRLPNELKFNFTPAKSVKLNNKVDKISGLITCICRKDTNDNFIADISDTNDDKFKHIKTCPFTEDSFNLKNKLIIFMKNKDEKNHYVQVHRDELDAMLGPESSNIFTTLCENHKFSGYLVKVNNIIKFKLKSFVCE